MATVKVRTLISGLPGFDALGNRIELQPGIPAWMDEATAKRLERQGKLQCLAGLSTQDLKPVQEEASAESGKKPKRKGYKRRDITAEPAVAADIAEEDPEDRAGSPRDE